MIKKRLVFYIPTTLDTPAVPTSTSNADTSDPFGEFLAAPPPPPASAASAPPANPSLPDTSTAASTDTVKQEEENFFNQKAPDGEKLTKDSILALYAKSGGGGPQQATQLTAPPHLVQMSSQMNPQLNPQMQQMTPQMQQMTPQMQQMTPQMQQMTPQMQQMAPQMMQGMFMPPQTSGVSQQQGGMFMGQQQQQMMMMQQQMPQVQATGIQISAANPFAQVCSSNFLFLF